MGRISHIEVNNFKSYGGHQVIGPFSDFTAVIGPNGAGKSNLMDAISFVLGVKSRKLRGKNARALIHDPSSSGEPRSASRSSSSAFVQLVFVTDEAEVEAGAAESAGEEIVFRRTISASGGKPWRRLAPPYTPCHLHTSVKALCQPHCRRVLSALYVAFVLSFLSHLSSFLDLLSLAASVLLSVARSDHVFP